MLYTLCKICLYLFVCEQGQLEMDVNELDMLIDTLLVS